MRTAYRPRSEVRYDLRGAWYRCPIAPARLRALMQRSDTRGWLQAGGQPALCAATGVRAFVAWSIGELAPGALA